MEWKICKTNLCSKLRFYLDNFIPIPLKVCADNISRWWCCKKDKAKAATKFCGSSQRNRAGKLHQKIKNEKQKLLDDGCYESGIVWTFFVRWNKIPSAKVLATEINNVLREILFRWRNMKNYFRNKSDFSYRWHEFKVAGRSETPGTIGRRLFAFKCLSEMFEGLMGVWKNNFLQFKSRFRLHLCYRRQGELQLTPCSLFWNICWGVWQWLRLICDVIGVGEGITDEKTHFLLLSHFSCAVFFNRKWKTSENLSNFEYLFIDVISVWQLFLARGTPVLFWHEFWNFGKFFLKT